jgi:nicotinate dehydrogenase subunit B
MSVDTPQVSRRAVLQGAGALVVAFSLAPRGFAAEAPASKLPGSLAQTPLLDAWIRIDAHSSVTVFTGKVEFGQGIKTALLQVVAEELEVPFEQLQLVTADTARTANEGYTAGSRSMQDSGTALRHAAAQVREILIGEAARRWNVPADSLKAVNAAVVAADGRRASYGDLVAAEQLHAAAQPVSKLKDPTRFGVMNRSVPRIDIPAKLTGGAAFIQDMRLPGMLHARVVRPPSYAARLTAIDLAGIEHLPGVVKVVRDGNFLAVAAEREFQAIKAMRAMADAAHWEEKPSLPRQDDLGRVLLSLPSQDATILDQQAPTATAARQLEASYSRPYLAHASIGPSCAIARLDNDVLTVWTHTQGPYPLRQALAEMLGLPAAKVHCIHVEGAGCYGHNGADDAAADAALIASLLPGRAIRVQWMREQEHGWEPYGAAMVAKVRAALDRSGRIASWEYGVWSNTHSMRPGPAGSLLAARHMSRAFPVPAPRALPQPEGGGDRNAIPLYALPNAKVVHHFIPTMPIRVSALRALGAHTNVFAIESFMDELAQAAGADPVEFRLAHMNDPRARDVIAAAAELFRWRQRAAGGNGRGCGFGFARYKNLGAYCAVAMEVEVARDSGQARVVRIAAAVDTGQVVNPDGVRNQTEGAIMQSMSWALFEQVGFDDTRVTSLNWASYPILRFSAVPDSVEVRIIDRPGLPFLGCGEAGQGPATAALANAIANATGKRLRDLPLTAARVKAALSA